MKEIDDLLAGRRNSMNPSWLGQGPGQGSPAFPRGLRVGIRNYGDDFVFMLAAIMRGMGHAVSFVPALDGQDDCDLYLLGPGPGDPGDPRHPGTAAVARDLDVVFRKNSPFLAVCLSHQVLARRLGLRTRRLPVPRQGDQREVDVFGTSRRLAFYNSFAVLAPAGAGPRGLELSLDGEEVVAMRGHRFWSVQFHPESILSVDGTPVLRAVLDDLAEVAERTTSARVKEVSR